MLPRSVAVHGNCIVAAWGQSISGPVDQRDIYRSLFFPLSSIAENWREARQEVARLLKAEDTPIEFHPALELLLDSLDELKEQHEKCWRDVKAIHDRLPPHRIY